MSWRRRGCGCGASSPRRRRPAARRSPSALRAVSEAPGGVGGAHLVDGARGDHRVDARVDPRVERIAVHDEADQARGMARVGGPELVGPRRRLELAELVRSSSRRTIRLRSRGSTRRAGPRRAARELGVQRLGSAALELGLPAARAPRRAPRAQIELGERGAQVQAGAADHDRKGALREQRVDLARAPARRTRRPRSARRRAGSRPGGAPGARARPPARTPVSVSRPLVDLQRVGRDRDRPLAAARSRSASAKASAVLPTPVGPKIASTEGAEAATAQEYRPARERAHRLWAVDRLRPAPGGDRGGSAGPRGARGRARRRRLRLLPPAAHLAAPGGDARGRARGARAARAGRLRRRRRARRRARDRARHRGGGVGGGARRRPRRGLPRST